MFNLNQAGYHRPPNDGLVPYRGTPLQEVPITEGAVPFRNTGGGSDVEQKILNAVYGEEAMKQLKAPAITQEEAKEQLTRSEGRSPSSLPTSAPVPQETLNKMQQQKDKSHQQVVKEYMKKREALAKNTEERAKLLGENFEQKTDLSPLMQLSDMWFGGNLAQGYKRPETRAEMEAKQMALQQQAGGQYGDLIKDEMGLLRNQQQADQMLHNQDMAKKNLGLGYARLNMMRDKMNQDSKGLNLNSGQIKRLDDINLAMQGLKNARSAVSKGGEIHSETRTNVMGDNEYSMAVNMFSEGIGRLQSGGVIGKDEGENFRRMLPTWRDIDNPKIMQQKFDQVEAALQARLRNIQGQYNYGAPQVDKGMSGHQSAYGGANQVQQNTGDAESWLKANPNHPKANEVRAALYKMGSN